MAIVPNARTHHVVRSAAEWIRTRRRPVPLVMLAASGICAAVATGCGQQQTLLQRDAVQFPQAVALYQNGCSTCHGNNLQGGIGPSLQHVGSALTLAAIVHRIEVGGAPMPAYAIPGDSILTHQQIRTLAQWLQTQR